MKLLQTSFETGSLINKADGSLLVNNGAVFRRGDMGKELVFDGVSYVDIDYLIPFLSATSTGGWCVNVSTSQSISSVSSQEIIAFGDTDALSAIAIAIQINTGKATLACYDSGVLQYNLVTDERVFFDNKPVSLGVSHDGAEPLIYVNNEAVAQTFTTSVDRTKWFSSIPGLDKGRIGSINFNSGGDQIFLDGVVLDAVINDRVLTSQERNDSYAKFLARTNVETDIRNFQYAKPNDLSNEEGLTAAYNMIPSAGGVLTDISGNGNNGVINGALQTLGGMAFDGVDDYCEVPYSPELKSDTFTLQATVKLNSVPAIQSWVMSMWGAPVEEKVFGILFFDGLGGDSIEFLYHTDTGGSSILVASILISEIVGKKATIQCVHGATSDKIFINGVDVSDGYRAGSFSAGITQNTNNLFLGSRSDATQNAEINLIDSRIMNKEATDQQIEDYHNQYANQLSLAEDFRYAHADGSNVTPLFWDKGTGDFKISEDVNGKYLECVNSGTIFTQSKQAYGTWEFDFDLEVTAGAIRFNFISDAPNPNLNDFNGYRFAVNNTGKVNLVKDTVGGPIEILLSSPVSYIDPSKKYRIRVKRYSDGTFYVYTRQEGGVFEIVPADTGTNPYLDNTYKVCSFMGIDPNAGDKVSNIILKKGVAV